jgi:hypothetical protein
VLICFVMGQGMVLLSIAAVFAKIISPLVYKTMILLLGFVYTAFAIGQFFDGRKILSYIKAFFAYLLGYTTFYIAMILISLCYDFALKAI